jgi:hypothetical protein
MLVYSYVKPFTLTSHDSDSDSSLDVTKWVMEVEEKCASVGWWIEFRMYFLGIRIRTIPRQVSF